nr:unnamed protein product [Spirometra erinaceieuropaei]
MLINTANNPDTSSNANTTTADTSGEDQDYTCPHCDRTFTSNISLVVHLRIHGTVTGKPVPRAPTYTPPHQPPLPTLPSHIHAPHGSIRPHAHSRKPAVENHRLHYTTTFLLTAVSPLINITHRKHPTATSHSIGRCASRLGFYAAPVAWMTRA